MLFTNTITAAIEIILSSSQWTQLRHQLKNADYDNSPMPSQQGVAKYNFTSLLILVMIRKNL